MVPAGFKVVTQFTYRILVMSSIPESHILCTFEVQSMRVISDDAKSDLLKWDHGR